MLRRARFRSAETARIDSCVVKAFLSDSLGVEMGAIDGRHLPLGGTELFGRRRALSSGYALIPGARRVFHFGVEVGS